MSLTIHNGDARDILPTLAEGSVHCCVTSPPYWGLRDYKHKNQIGMEKTPDQFVNTMVLIFREVRRVLRDDGTCWLNLGDSYASNAGGYSANGSRGASSNKSISAGTMAAVVQNRQRRPASGLKEKDLCGIPWRVALALQADGWYLRQDIIWSKPNPMPESVTDRCTKAHEYIFMLTKSPRYFYDAEAIRNPPSEAMIQQVEEGYAGRDTKDYEDFGAQSASGTKARIIEGMRKRVDKQRGHSQRHAGFNERWDKMSVKEQCALGSNKRSVWTVATHAFKGAHFATFPPDLIQPCILAGCPAGGTVLDPFGGSGTTGAVALELGRSAVLIELNPDYAAMCEARCNITPGLALA